MKVAKGEAMKILLAVDGSSFSDAAVAEIAQRPWPTGSEIKVICAFEIPLPPTAEAWAIPPEYIEELNDSAQSNARTVVGAAVEMLKKSLGQSLAITGEFVQGSPRNAILDEADRWKADLIVMGSHGHGAWQRFLLGSVSQTVVAHAKCSVEVVHRRLDYEKENSRAA
jgi:nucleotide-binding universal stress UspA family protein